MSCFRINLYLPLKYFVLSFFISKKNIKKKIKDKLRLISNKNDVIITSQLRVGFILILQYLKKKNPKKKEIIINSYNLAEMANICKNLNLKIIYPELNKNLFLSKKSLNKNINKKTLAVVSTNIFNTYEDSISVKSICRKRKIPLIEDNAIYFGNYKKIKSKKIYAGSFGDYSLNSFNIMKNVSAMYGGSVTTDDKNFILFAKESLKNFENFPIFKYLKQCLIYLLLKIFSINLIYKHFFLKIIKRANTNNNLFFLGMVYPSLKFKKKKLPQYYSSKISNLSIKMIYLQLMDDSNFEKNHSAKRNNNFYYQKLLTKKKINGLNLFKYNDRNFQNYNDFPILVKNKANLVQFLFSKGIETKTIQYVDCHKIFKTQKKEKLESYENKVLCLPNHKLISKKYIEYIVGSLTEFYEKN